MPRSYLLRPGVDPAGDTAVIVHLSRDNGHVKEGQGRAAGTPWTSIRLLVSVDKTLQAFMSLSAVDRVINEGEGFERLERDSGSQMYSVLRFNGPCGQQVPATEWSSASPGSGIYLAEMQMDGLFLRQSRSDIHYPLIDGERSTSPIILNYPSRGGMVIGDELPG